MFENHNNQEEAEKGIIATVMDPVSFVYFEWLQYNRKYQLPEEQVKLFLKNEQETNCVYNGIA
jgi:hypothetical protein